MEWPRTLLVATVLFMVSYTAGKLSKLAESPPENNCAYSCAYSHKIVRPSDPSITSPSQLILVVEDPLGRDVDESVIDIPFGEDPIAVFERTEVAAHKLNVIQVDSGLINKFIELHGGKGNVHVAYLLPAGSLVIEQLQDPEPSVGEALKSRTEPVFEQ